MITPDGETAADHDARSASHRRHGERQAAANIAPLKRDMLLADHIVPGVNDLVPDRAQDLVRADAAERSLSMTVVEAAPSDRR
jgi:hypothetical protein